MTQTLTDDEQEQPSDPSQAHLLCHVLSYEDLLAQPLGALRLDRLPELCIGRAEGEQPVGFVKPGTLRLADAWMSGRHASISRAGEAMAISDLGSRNGVLLDGERISGRRTLADGARIEIGHSLFIYRRLPAEVADALDAPEPELAFGGGRTWCAELAFVLRRVGKIATSKQPVLLLAETGSGKELLAQQIHARSGRRGRLVAVDCGAIPDALFESTMFGHVRGAFTGAEGRLGELRAADQGSLFLDEVGNLSTANQAKLLRVLETSQLAPLGAAESAAIDVRWIAATNEDLLAEPGRFRADLFHRLAGFVAEVPPLRERREDLGVLTSQALKEAGLARASIAAPAARRLFAHAFPGNVRQLRSWVKTAALLAGDGPIRLDHLPDLGERPSVEAPAPAAAPAPAEKKQPSAEELSAALTTTKGNVVRAAKLLGTHPRQLYRWLDALKLSLEDFRDR